MSRWRDDHADMRGRRVEGYYTRGRRGKVYRHRQRSEDRRSYENEGRWGSPSSFRASAGLRNQMAGRLGQGDQRREYSRRKGEVRILRREMQRKEQQKEHETRGSRDENLYCESYQDRNRKKRRDESSKRSPEDHRKERGYQNVNELRTPKEERRKDSNFGEVGRIDCLAVPSEDCMEKINTPEKKSDIKGLILSIFNKTKQMDQNGNVVWDQEVLNDLQEILNENTVEEKNFKDYSYHEFSGLLPNHRHVEDQMYEQVSEWEESGDDDSSKGKLEPGTFRKQDIPMATESRHKSWKRSSSTGGPKLIACRNDDEDDIDDDYMISIMKEVVSQNDKGKQAVNQNAPSPGFWTSEDSAEEARTLKTPNPSTYHADGNDSKTAQDENISPKLKIKELQNECGSYGEGTSFSSLSSLPTPRPASASVHHGSDVEPNFVPEAASFCSSSFQELEDVQNQSEGWEKSPVDECAFIVANVCDPLSAEVWMSLPDNVATVSESEGIVIPEEDKVSKVLTQKKIIFIDAENDISEVKKEEKYEEPSPDIFEHIDLRANTRFTPITQRMHQVITGAMLSINEVVLSRHNIDITKHDLFTLTGDNWLNDQVVEMFLTMIAQRSTSLKYVLKQLPKVHSMSTYFFTNLYTRGYSAVKKWTKGVDIFTFDLVLVPIHMDSHWSLASVDFRVPGVFYYDSLGSTVNDNFILSALLHYLSKEHMDKKGEDINLSKFAKHAMDTPLQQNGSDCGVFCCKVGDSLSRDLQLDFSQEDIKYFRKRMIFEILRGVLLEP